MVVIKHTSKKTIAEHLESISSENLDKENFDWDKFDSIIDNDGFVKIGQQNEQTYDALRQWDYMPELKA